MMIGCSTRLEKKGLSVVVIVVVEGLERRPCPSRRGYIPCDRRNRSSRTGLRDYMSQIPALATCRGSLQQELKTL